MGVGGSRITRGNIRGISGNSGPNQLNRILTGPARVIRYHGWGDDQFDQMWSVGDFL